MTKHTDMFERAFVNMIHDLLWMGTTQLRFQLDKWAVDFNAASQTHVLTVKYSDQDDRWFVIERKDKERLLTLYIHSVSGALTVEFSPNLLVQELKDICAILSIPAKDPHEVQS